MLRPALCDKGQASRSRKPRYEKAGGAGHPLVLGETPWVLPSTPPPLCSSKCWLLCRTGAVCLPSVHLVSSRPREQRPRRYLDEPPVREKQNKTREEAVTIRRACAFKHCEGLTAGRVDCKTAGTKRKQAAVAPQAGCPETAVELRTIQVGASRSGVCEAVCVPFCLATQISLRQ